MRIYLFVAINNNKCGFNRETSIHLSTSKSDFFNRCAIMYQRFHDFSFNYFRMEEFGNCSSLGCSITAKALWMSLSSSTENGSAECLLVGFWLVWLESRRFFVIDDSDCESESELSSIVVGMLIVSESETISELSEVPIDEFEFSELIISES